MANQETNIVNKIRLDMSSDGVLLLRNNTGAYKTDAGHYVRYGVGEKGGSDLIGITPVKITAGMVGRTVGVFTAIEVKTKKGRATDAQVNFINSIKRQCGIAGIARCTSDVIKIIKGFINDDNQ